MSIPLFPLSSQQKFDWLRLIRSDNVGPQTFRSLLNKFGSAAAALEALPGLGVKSGRSIHIADADVVAREMEESAALGVVFIGMGEPDYPEALRQIASPPPIIAVRGQISVLARPKIAIVGSRNASAAGLAFTERLARGFGMDNYIVISGLARGVDLRAHRTCLRSGTIAVLAGGHACVYPSDHVALAEEILATGALVSEMPLHWEPRGRDFPRRNRIVSGLSRAVVVVEAARHSGSLITAKFALEQGREVFSVPGSPLDPRAEGTNDLLRQGAALCTSPEDVLQTLAQSQPRQPDLFNEGEQFSPTTEPLWDEWDLLGEAALERESVPRTIERMEMDETAVSLLVEPMVRSKAQMVELMGPSPITIDDLARLSEIPLPKLRQFLLELEIEGRLERHGASMVSLIMMQS